MLVGISAQFGKKARALVTDMNEPLARTIGTGIEVAEARDLLVGRNDDPRARAGCLQIAAAMLELGGVANPIARAERALADGSAYEKFIEMIEAQGGSRAAVEALTPDPRVREVRAEHDGTISAIDAVALGHLARALTHDTKTGGLSLHARVGDRVSRGALLAEIFGTGVEPEQVLGAFTVGENSPAVRPLVYASL
jgi:thymidine phosphorylase